MAFKHITSRDNPIFKQLKKLAESARARSKEGKTLLDGVHLIETYVQTFGEPELIIVPEGKSTAEATHLMQALTDVPTMMLPTLMFAELTPVASSTGILALISIPNLQQTTHPEFVLMLEDIQDPGNLGAMLRTALGAGVQAVICSQGCTDAWSPKCLRGGQGAQFFMPIVEGADIVEMLGSFQGNSFATVLDGESLFRQTLTGPCAFVIGNEGNGLSQAAIDAASHKISIPMNPQLESLNAAAATAICLFERRRQQG